jgi:hypothetical protein
MKIHICLSGDPRGSFRGFQMSSDVFRCLQMSSDVFRCLYPGIPLADTAAAFAKLIPTKKDPEGSFKNLVAKIV